MIFKNTAGGLIALLWRLIKVWSVCPIDNRVLVGNLIPADRLPIGRRVESFVGDIVRVYLKRFKVQIKFASENSEGFLKRS